MKKNYIIILVSAIAIMIIATLYYFILVKKTESSVSIQSILEATTTSPATSFVATAIAISNPPPEGYIKYTNQKYSFSFYHSPQAKIKEFNQGQGSMIITLENEQKVRGLQIFIVPYYKNKISEERFKADVPSGVRTNIESSSVDGVEAVTFNSFDESLGDTREIWIIRGGYLYEITTFKGVGDWLAPILQTWKFI